MLIAELTTPMIDDPQQLAVVDVHRALEQVELAEEATGRRDAAERQQADRHRERGARVLRREAGPVVDEQALAALRADVRDDRERADRRRRCTRSGSRRSSSARSTSRGPSREMPTSSTPACEIDEYASMRLMLSWRTAERLPIVIVIAGDHDQRARPAERAVRQHVAAERDPEHADHRGDRGGLDRRPP